MVSFIREQPSQLDVIQELEEEGGDVRLEDQTVQSIL